MIGLTPGAGGTQRMAERAGPARAREFVMSQGIYDAATLERWNVVNRVLPDDQLLEKGMRFAQRLAAGPTRAHAATKRIVRAYLKGGVDEADEVTPRSPASCSRPTICSAPSSRSSPKAPARPRSRAS